MMMDMKRSGFVPFDLHIHDLDYIVSTFGKPDTVQGHRSVLPNQDYISVTYGFPEFFIVTESSWYAAPLPFETGFRFQFEDALITYSDGKCIIYQNDETSIDLSSITEGDTGSINLPKSNAYAAEIRYFTDCVNKGIFPERIKPEELYTVLDILNSL